MVVIAIAIKGQEFFYRASTAHKVNEKKADLCCYDKKECSYADVKHDIKEYRISDNAPKRIIERRELNVD